MKTKLLLIVQILIISAMTNLNAQDKKTFAPSDKVVTERVSFISLQICIVLKMQKVRCLHWL